MSNYVSIKDLNLSEATVIGFNYCSVEVIGDDLVCYDIFSRVVAKFPFEVNARFLLNRGLPEEVGIDEEGNFEIFEIDPDDEDYFGNEDQPDFILDGYSHISTMNFTIIIKNHR